MFEIQSSGICQVLERLVSTFEHISNWTGPGVKRSNCNMLLACRVRCKCSIETLEMDKKVLKKWVTCQAR